MMKFSTNDLWAQFESLQIAFASHLKSLPILESTSRSQSFINIITPLNKWEEQIKLCNDPFRIISRILS